MSDGTHDASYYNFIKFYTEFDSLYRIRRKRYQASYEVAT